DDVCWLFIGEIEGEKYDMLRPEHRAAAARWLGILHTEARFAADQAGLPDAGPSRYRAQMRATRDLIRDQVDNPAFGGADVAFLDGLVARFEELEIGRASCRERVEIAVVAVTLRKKEGGEVGWERK